MWCSARLACARLRCEWCAQGFVEFCQAINPQYALPSRDALVNALKDECARLVKQVKFRFRPL